MEISQPVAEVALAQCRHSSACKRSLLMARLLPAGGTSVTLGAEKLLSQGTAQSTSVKSIAIVKEATIP